MANVLTDPAAAQDAMRPLRNFVSLIGGVNYADQSWASSDAYAINTVGQVSVLGPNGQVVEGKPIVVGPANPDQRPRISPLWLVLGGGLLAYLLAKHG